jgi:putative endonuclease
MVAAELTAQGFSVHARNWLGGGGELDVVAERDGCIRFVEVKARGPGDPVGLESVGPAKRRKLTRAAEAWLARWDGTVEEVSFSVVLVEDGALTWVHDAFDSE